MIFCAVLLYCCAFSITGRAVFVIVPNFFASKLCGFVIVLSCVDDSECGFVMLLCDFDIKLCGFVIVLMREYL